MASHYVSRRGSETRPVGQRMRGRGLSRNSKCWALAAIAYRQPITRAELSRLAGHDISRDILGRLKSAGIIAPGPHAPQPGAPIAWVTTARFLEVFALGSLRDLPELESSTALEKETPTTASKLRSTTCLGWRMRRARRRKAARSTRWRSRALRKSTRRVWLTRPGTRCVLLIVLADQH
ncbi:MAG: SMC-Scp complex subunit ScpB [Methylocystis sp.]|uniref:SMC-Scp complex subunit ScpB n=1 Tax=Methylocystis sp. TaxID=1911079 RepID=UPI003DA4D123